MKKPTVPPATPTPVVTPEQDAADREVRRALMQRFRS